MQIHQVGTRLVVEGIEARGVLRRSIGSLPFLTKNGLAHRLDHYCALHMGDLFCLMMSITNELQVVILANMDDVQVQYNGHPMMLGPCSCHDLYSNRLFVFHQAHLYRD